MTDQQARLLANHSMHYYLLAAYQLSGRCCQLSPVYFYAHRSGVLDLLCCYELSRRVFVCFFG
jgi:hypothetical protein